MSRPAASPIVVAKEKLSQPFFADAPSKHSLSLSLPSPLRKADVTAAQKVCSSLLLLLSILRSQQFNPIFRLPPLLLLPATTELLEREE